MGWGGWSTLGGSSSSSSGGGLSSSAPPSSIFEGANAPASALLDRQEQQVNARLGLLASGALSGGGGGGGSSAADRAAMLDLLNRGFDVQGRQLDTQASRVGLQGQQLDLKGAGIQNQMQGQDLQAQQLGLKGAGLGTDLGYLQSLLPDYTKERSLAEQLYASQNRQDTNTYNSQKRLALDDAASRGAYTSSGTRAGLGELNTSWQEAMLQNDVGRFGRQSHLMSIGQNERQTQGDIIKNKLAQQGVQLDLSQVGLNKKDLTSQLKGLDLDKLANSLDLQDVQALRDQLAIERQKATLSSTSGGGGGGGSAMSSSDIQAMWNLQDKLDDILYNKGLIEQQNASGSQLLPSGGGMSSGSRGR